MSDKTKVTITDADIVTRRRSARRTFLRGLGAALGGAVATVLGVGSAATAADGKQDSDTSRMADRHLEDSKGDSSGKDKDNENSDWDADSDMRTWADKKRDSD